MWKTRLLSSDTDERAGKLQQPVLGKVQIVTRGCCFPGLFPALWVGQLRAGALRSGGPVLTCSAQQMTCV